MAWPGARKNSPGWRNSKSIAQMRGPLSKDLWLPQALELTRLQVNRPNSSSSINHSDRRLDFSGRIPVELLPTHSLGKENSGVNARAWGIPSHAK